MGLTTLRTILLAATIGSGAYSSWIKEYPSSGVVQHLTMEYWLKGKAQYSLPHH